MNKNRHHGKGRRNMKGGIGRATRQATAKEMRERLLRIANDIPVIDEYGRGFNNWW